MQPADWMLGIFRQRRLDLQPHKECQGGKERKGDKDKFIVKLTSEVVIGVCT